MPSSAEQKSFSYIFICEANKNIDQAKDVRTKSEKTSAFEMVSTEVQAEQISYKRLGNLH